MGFARSFDAFFRMNPDMIELKEKLISELDKEVLVVLPYSQKGAQGNEIKIDRANVSLAKEYFEF